MLEAVIIGSGRSTPGLFSMRRRILRLRRFNWRWILAFTRKPPEGEQASVVKHLDYSRKPGWLMRRKWCWPVASCFSARAFSGPAPIWPHEPTRVFESSDLKLTWGYALLRTNR